MLIAYIFLIIALGVFSYYGLGFFIQKWEEAQRKKAETTVSELERMFIYPKKWIIISIYIGSPLLLCILVFILVKKVWVIPISIIVGVIFPIWFIRKMERRRKEKFVHQLVDGLLIMNSCLKGGLNLVQAFEVVAEEMTPPISDEISLMVKELKVGLPLEEALIRLDRRMPSEEMTLVSSAILVARETGGDLTKVFLRLIETIRDRIKLKELVFTLTLQARLQAIIISLLGPTFFFVVKKFNPDHFNIMWESHIGRVLLIIAVVLQVVGIILIAIFGRVRI